MRRDPDRDPSVHDSLRRDVAQTWFDEAEQAVRDHPGCGDPEQPFTVRRVRELLERAVEADRVVGLVVDGGLEEKQADQPEDDETRDMAGESRAAPPLPHRRRARVHAPLVLELPGDTTVEVPERDADEHEPGDPDEPRACGPRQHDGGRMVRLRVLGLVAARGREDADRRVGEPRVDQPTADVAGALAPHLRLAVLAVGALRVRLDEAPERVGGEAEGERDQDDLTERVLRELRQRALTARRRAAVADRQLDREQADERVRDALRDEADPREDGVPPATLFCLCARVPRRLLEGCHMRTTPVRAVAVRGYPATASSTRSGMSKFA